ncbi:MAG: hypothetical protein AAGH90_05060 [Pseudomonadota bacterium]
MRDITALTATLILFCIASTATPFLKAEASSPEDTFQGVRNVYTGNGVFVCSSTLFPHDKTVMKHIVQLNLASTGPDGIALAEALVRTQMSMNGRKRESTAVYAGKADGSGKLAKRPELRMTLRNYTQRDDLPGDANWPRAGSTKISVDIERTYDFGFKWTLSGYLTRTELPESHPGRFFAFNCTEHKG